MKKVLRWIVIVLIVLILLVVAALFSVDPVARSIAEKRVAAETGMETKIGRLDLGLTTRTVHLENFRLISPVEFGGGTFVDIPELFIEVDVEALQENRLHLKNVRFNLAELHIVETKDGKKNTDIFQKHGKAKREKQDKKDQLPGEKTKTQTPDIEFAGIDRLEVSLGRSKFTSERYPNRNFDRDLGVRSRVFKDIKTEKDLETVGVLLGAQAGLHMLLEGALSNPVELLKKGSDSGKEAKEVLEDLAVPLQKQ
jgi:uncharacterized protein involved in outer membrane biogenesis